MDKRRLIKIAIIGVGNPLCGDDGLGVYLAQNPHPELPSNVDIIDGGTAGPDLLRFLEEYDRLIILDIVRYGGEPGGVVTFVPGETGEISTRGSHSAHGVDLAFALRLRNSLGYRADVVVVGCEPLHCGVGEGLSEPVRRAIPQIWKEVQRELGVTSDQNAD